MSNKFLELISSPLMNLDHTHRYSGTKLVEEETLSQHIVDTIMMGIKVIDEINHIAGREMLSTTKYVMKAVYHDLEECITGDIPRPVKYYDEHTRDSLKNVADQVAKKFFDEQFHDGEPHYAIWESAKEDNEGYILKIVDTLVVANKVVKEVSILNNFYMLRVAHEVSQYLEEQYNSLIKCPDDAVTLYLMDLLLGAIQSMKKIMKDNDECMNSLHIHAQSMI